MEIAYTGGSVRHDPLITWELGADSFGKPFECHNIEILSVAFEGTFAGSEAVLEGAIGDEFHYLMSKEGSMVSATGSKIRTVSGRYVKVRPQVLNGSDRTKIKVILYGRKLR